MFNIQFAAAKVNKYASRESGDTVELVERPTAPGGFTIVLADGQGSGRNAKTLSNLVISRCVALLKEGVRDGVVARAANDHLYAYRHGQVSATLNMISADFSSRTLVITRNNPEPVYLFRLQKPVSNVQNAEAVESKSASDIENWALDSVEYLDEPSVALGIYPRIRPVVREFELVAGLVAVAFSDGISGAGSHQEEKLDVVQALRQMLNYPAKWPEAQAIADELLEVAVSQDRRRPQDDMSVIVVTIGELTASDDGAPLPRRFRLNVPFQ